MDPTLFLFTLIYLIPLAGITAKPSSYRWLFFPPVAAISIYLCSYADIEQVVTPLLASSDYLLLTDVQRELHMIGQQGSISDASLWSRLKWSLQLMTGLRGIGWAHEPTSSLPPRPNLTRGRFIISRALWLVFYALVFDIGQTFIRHNPSFEQTAVPFAEQDLLWRSWCMLLFLATSVPILSITLNLVPAIVYVAAGISEPNAWPHLYGRFSDAYTVRNFWSRTWHQLLRRRFVSHGRYLAHSLLRLTPGSKLSGFVQVCVAFFLSGLVHTRSWSDGGALRFYMLQVIAITVEDIIISLVKKLGLDTRRHSFSYFGYVWVWCWLLYSLPYYWDSMIYSGMLEQGKPVRFLISISRGDLLLSK